MPIQQWNVGQPEYTRQAQQGIFSNTLTALGNTQGTAFQCATDFCVFTTVAASTGCLLLGGQDQTGTSTGPCLPADNMILVNHGANTLAVYPQSGGKIANGATNAAFSVAANKTAYFTYLGSGSWAASVSA